MILFHSFMQLENSPIKYGNLGNVYQGKGQTYLDKSHKYKQFFCMSVCYYHVTYAF